MAYKIIASKEQMDEMRVKYGPRKGLEGPFLFAGGQVLYYDPQEGKYWNPRSDFYMSHEEMDTVHNNLMRLIRAES